VAKKTPKLRVNLMLTEATYKRLQHVALDENTSASAIVDKLIAGYLKARRQKRAERKVAP
jgi:hypothetical protein